MSASALPRHGCPTARLPRAEFPEPSEGEGAVRGLGGDALEKKGFPEHAGFPEPIGASR